MLYSLFFKSLFFFSILGQLHDVYVVEYLVQNLPTDTILEVLSILTTDNTGHVDIL